MSATHPPFDPQAQPSEPADQMEGRRLAAVPAERLNPAFLRARFAAPPAWEPEPGDEARTTQSPRAGGPIPAAVLVPLVMREELTVLLTLRTAHLHDHAGQISFPGGRVEQSDADAIATALRETEEEVGLEHGHVEIVGSLHDYLTGTGFRVTPIVGLVTPGFRVAPDSFEVAEVFEVPLAFLMDPSYHRLHRVRLPEGLSRSFYSMPYADGPAERFIWGATAGMLRNLYHFLRA